MASRADHLNLETRQCCVLITAVFVIAACGIFYELLISSASAYFLGSSILHFSLTIGLFMFFMGVGSYLSRLFNERLLERLITVEIALGIVGGISTPLLYAAFSLTEYYYLTAFLLIAVISMLIGLELPLATRIIQTRQSLKDALANILAFDYMGALIASLLFPLLLLPYLGVIQTAFVIGILNLAVAAVLAWQFRSRLAGGRRTLLAACAGVLLLSCGWLRAAQLTTFFERYIYQDEIIYAERTPYQRIVLTRFNDDVRLFSNGNIQFSSIDEYRYHEPLVHVPLSLAHSRESVLVLGGGDGLAVRELLKYPDVTRITVVDIDAAMTNLARRHAVLAGLNQNSLVDERVTVVNADAFTYIRQDSNIYSAIIIDLPDPNDLSLGKLYSLEFYRQLKGRLGAEGILVTQSTSPYQARRPFWSIHRTLKEVFPSVLPYTVYVPSFGQWGFNAASSSPLRPTDIKISVPVKFLDAAVLGRMFLFDSDTAKIPAAVNRLDNQVLVQYYEESWAHWN